jgi:hypothetical protein
MTTLASLKREIEVVSNALMIKQDTKMCGQETNALLWINEALINFSQVANRKEDTTEAQIELNKAVANYEKICHGGLFHLTKQEESEIKPYLDVIEYICDEET